MDPASSINLVSKKTQLPKQQLADILNDPKKTLYFMIGIAALGAIFFSGYLAIESAFTAAREVKKLQKPTIKVEENVGAKFDQKRQQEVEVLNSAIKNYYSKNNTYPQSLSNLVPQFLANLPRDPETQKEYSYRVSLDFKSYEVWALLDNGQEYLLSN